MKNLLIILVAIAFLSCSNDNENEIICCYNLESFFDFSVFNQDGEDLLNPNSLNKLDQRDIKIFYVLNGESQEVNLGSNYAYPRGFRIYEYQSEYRIRVFLNHSENESKPITYIKWGEDYGTDKIDVSFQRHQNSLLQDTIWLNDEKIWERGDNTTNPYLSLIK
ncbi:hypothetical protein [Polaribacter sp. M15]|jgi:hypothetical protein